MARGGEKLILEAMRRKLSVHALLVSVAAMSALALTVVKKSHESVTGFSFQSRTVLAAPGTPKEAKHDLSKLAVFNMTLLRVRESYVDPSRIDPKRMLYQALDSVQLNIPEVLVEADPTRDSLTVVVNDQRQTFATADVDSPWRLAGRLKKIFEFIEANMNPGADLAEVEYAAVNGMLATLDPHSILMDPEAASELDVSTSGKFGGLGIVIRMIDRKLTVIRPIKNTPAARAGIKAGDHIVKIDNQSTDVLTSDEAVDRMRGEPSTAVTLWVARQDEPKPLRFDLTRAQISVESVQAKLLDKNVGLIKIKNFQGSTAAETARALEQLKQQGAKAFVVDLRYNPGGLLDQAVKVSDLFVDEGTLVTTVKGGQRKPRRATRDDGETGTPLAVLVNTGSASASEIVAGALKNLDRAIVIGTRTFGKGSVQQLYREDDGTMLKLTVEQYLTPGDRSIQSVGIVPDIALQRMYVPAKNDASGDFVRLLAPSKSWGEKDLDAHLTSQFARDTDKPSYELAFLFQKPTAAGAAAPAPALTEEQEEEEEDLSDDIVEDFEIGLARDLVAGQTAKTRSALVKTAGALIAKRRADEEQKISAALGKLGVDWASAPTAAASASRLSAAVALSPAGALQAGTTVTITGTVKNLGTAPVYRVHARASADDDVFDDAELVFGKIAPGETRTFSTRVEVPKDAIARVDRIQFDLRDAAGITTQVAPIETTIVAAPRPAFAYNHQLIDDGNGDGLLQRREKHRLRVRIRNTGAGVAPQATAILRNASGDGVTLDSSRMELGSIAPRETKTVEFGFTVEPDLEGDEAVIELAIYDAELGAQASKKIKIPVVTSAPPLVAAAGVIELKRDLEIRESASADSSVTAAAKKGARFKVLGTVGSWTKVDLVGTPGFVPTAATTPTARKAGNLAAELRFQVTPPDVKLALGSYEATGDIFPVRATVNDDRQVEDVQVFVTNAGAKIDTRKVFYRSNRGAKTPASLDFTANIPMWPGSNQVTIVARENTDVRTIQTFVVYREPLKTAAVEPTTSKP